MNQQKERNSNPGKNIEQQNNMHSALEHSRNQQQPDTRQSLGKKIRQFREQHGVTQGELAEEMSVTRQAVSNWEREKTLPDVYTLQQMAAYFGITLDELVEGTKEPEITMPKMPGRLAAATGLVSVCYLLAGGMTGHLYVETMITMIIIGIFCQLFLHLYFSNSVKTGNFSALAGYDSKVEYNQNEVKKVLVQMDQHVACISFGSVLLYAVGAFLGGEQADIFYGALTFAYCGDLIFALLLYNYRSLNRTLVKEQDRKAAKAGYLSIVWTAAWSMIFLGAIFAKMEFGSIENNSPQAAGILGWMFLFLLVVIAELFYEQHRVKKKLAETGAYRPGAAFWLSTAAVVAVTVLMLF
jgi:transcriptional regulator with XRE-family HTH domain